jgi:hypothetical protein
MQSVLLYTCGYRLSHNLVWTSSHQSQPTLTQLYFRFWPGWARPVNIWAANKGGIGAALLLGSCVIMGILLYRLWCGNGDKRQDSRVFTLPTRLAGFITLCKGTAANRPPGADRTETDDGCPLPASPDSGAVAQTRSVSTGTGTGSTALELLKENLSLSGTFANLEDPDLPLESALFTDVADGRTSAQPSAVPDGNVSQRGNASMSQGDSASSTFHSLWSRSWARQAVGEKKTRKSDKTEDDPHHEELWTRGVDPADVDILKDPRGRPVVLGRGACAVVYLGRWQATLVAVKMMLASDSDVAQKEVKAEADILRGLRHPNVALLMAICISAGQQVQQKHLTMDVLFVEMIGVPLLCLLYSSVLNCLIS